MNIEEKIKIESRKLSDFYYPYYMEERYPGAMDNFTDINTRYWQNKVFFAYKKYFEKAAGMFCVRNEYDAKKFIQSAMLDKFKYPQQLCVENVWKTYLQYLPGLKSKKSEEDEIAENVVNGLLEIKKYGSVKDWLKLSVNKRMVIEGKPKIEPTVLAFSNEFINFCKNNCEDNYNFEKMRRKVFNHKSSEKIISKIKKIFKDDYYN